MRLVQARVTNYRNIEDSNLVEIGHSTCLVGKNEAGKTAFLKALEGLRSTDQTYKKYDKTENYPRRYLADYKQRHPEKEAEVVQTTWELDDTDIAAVEADLGEGAIADSKVQITKAYEQDTTFWSVRLNNEKVIGHLAKRFGLTKDERAFLKDAKSTRDVAKALETVSEKGQGQKELLEAIKKFRKSDSELHAIDVLNKRTPHFLYFSHYDRMSGQIAINQLNADRQKPEGISSGDQVFLDFLEYAGTNLEELQKATRYEELNAKCEAAANRITDQIFEYWTQNDELRIDVRLTEGKPADPPPFNQGPIARARVENDLHRVSVPFSERSAGFIWFFSFLVKFAQIKKQQGNVIILLDEPGLTLHGTAQMDLLRYFKKELEPKHQIIYSTHSPFMVPPDNLLSVRTVEDVVVLDDRNRKQSIGTKVRADILTTDPQTNFPVFGAIGFEITQTLIIGKNTLLVEGPSDILYLQAVSSVLKAQDRPHLSGAWAVCPSGGIDKILPFVRLFYGNRLNIAVLTDFERGQKRKLDELYKSALLDHERITLATDIAGKEEADIEDFFEPELFVDLINATYELADEHRLSVEKLDNADKGTPRLVKKAEAYFRLLPQQYPEFSHYEPALYLLKHPDLLKNKKEKVVKSLERFEKAFERISKFVGA
jgi:predicted ATP-dependent endonuclease of OLD family